MQGIGFAMTWRPYGQTSWRVKIGGLCYDVDQKLQINSAFQT
ncbi:hypothetical protein MGWOODY_XGa171 [hydrothermal vent metagenome]|uniref:Uncharacterized protein n=1 Tax=hydrothermal vent metagenome TaxID=652676 RepID=A0A160TNB6_9ZZZZ